MAAVPTPAVTTENTARAAVTTYCPTVEVVNQLTTSLTTSLTPSQALPTTFLTPSQALPTTFLTPSQALPTTFLTPSQASVAALATLLTAFLSLLRALLKKPNSTAISLPSTVILPLSFSARIAAISVAESAVPDSVSRNNSPSSPTASPFPKRVSI